MCPIKHKKTLFLKIICIVLAAILGVLCAVLVTKNTTQVWSEHFNYSYLSSTNSNTDQTTSQAQISSQAEVVLPTIISAALPDKQQTLASGTSLKVVACAKVDSTKVTATFNGQTINLQKQAAVTQSDGSLPEFVDFYGYFTLPSLNENDINLGGVTFCAEWQGHIKRWTTPSIICLRDTALDRVTVVEIVADSAETFSGTTTDDNSDPRLSYLPKGTIDYKVGNTVYDAQSKNSYYKLRCGRRVYVDKKNPPDSSRMTVSKTYAGSVPDTNQISVDSNIVAGNHTYLTINTEWKAPFFFEIGPQNYNNPSIRDFTVQSFTASYVDIKFCYTTTIGGNLSIPSDNPLFASSQVIASDGGYVLRLHLKKVGGFYGWDCYYNSNGQLVFKFLNPKKVVSATNEYGTNLTGVNILIDVGHGGKDIGAGGLMPDLIPESDRNLVLATKLKTELEKMGATVTMTRYNNATVTAEQRCSILRQTSPNLCISIHHDSAENNRNGCGIFCFNAFSHNATSSIFNRTLNSLIYSNTYKAWHYFYLSRVTSCPVVLTENGFISSSVDFEGIKSDETNTKKAKAIAQGVADYFKTYQ